MPQVMGRLVAAGSPRGYELARSTLAAGGNAAHEALAALESAGTPTAVRAIEQAMSSNDVVLRRAAIGALGTLRAEGSEETIIAALRDGDDMVSAAAIRALGELGTDRTKSALIDVARNGSVDDKQLAVDSMRYVEDPAVSRALVDMIHDTDPAVAVAAIDAVVGRGTDIDGELRSMAGNSSATAEVRIRAAYILQSHGVELDPAVEKAIEELGGVIIGPEDM